MKFNACLQASCVCVAMTWAVVGFAQSGDELTCGSLTNAYGPYDYSDAGERALRLPIVEQYHFTPQVESLRAGQSGAIADDLDYTLRAFPNHHRALWAVAQLQLRDAKQLQKYRSADCYFDRAIRWRSQDATVRMVYGIYLARKGNRKEAVQQYQAAISLAPDNAEVHYNAGLVYLELNDIEKALIHAKRAYALGYPLPGLRKRLAQMGHSVDEAKPATPSPAP